MGTTATMKGGHGNMHMYGATNGSNIRRKWNIYLLTLIILLVFGAAFMGLMGIHRLRDRRLFNLLIKDKDAQILSLQHFLQKERERVQNDKMTIDEMKSKIYTLRAHNKELNRRLSEMDSTIASLKDEQKIIESALQEKQNEAISLRQSFEEIKDQNPQLQALEEMLKQKEAEIQDLQHLVQLPTNVDSQSITNQSQFEIPEKYEVTNDEKSHVEKADHNKNFNGEILDAEKKRGVNETDVTGNAANELQNKPRVSNKRADFVRANLSRYAAENVSRMDETSQKHKQVENSSSVKPQVQLHGMPRYNGSFIEHKTKDEGEIVKTENSEKPDDSYEDEAQIEGPEF